jgi:hypothetical protein
MRLSEHFKAMVKGLDKYLANPNEKAWRKFEKAHDYPRYSLCCVGEGKSVFGIWGCTPECPGYRTMLCNKGNDLDYEAHEAEMFKILLEFRAIVSIRCRI